MTETSASHDDWVARDVARVWHGFTQMSTFADNRPVIVDRAEGHELVDVDGNRFLDAISSMWVTTLGHRVAELDDAIQQQLARGAHSTMLGNGNRVVVELSEALARVVPVDDPHFLYASDGASAVEQALKIAWQHWVNTGTPRRLFLAFGGAYHGDTIGALSVGDGGFGADVFDALRFPVLRAPRLDDPDCADVATRMIAQHASDLAAVIVEPSVQAAAGMVLGDEEALRRIGDACRAHGVPLICDEIATGFGRTGTLFASERCGLRPDLLCLGKGMTAGYLPMSVTVASGELYRSFLGEDLGERTLYHGHSYGGNALAAAVALRHLELLDAWDVLANVRERSEELADLLHDRIAPKPAVRDVRLRGLMGGVELAPPRDGLRWGRRVSAAAVEQGVLLRPIGDTVILMPPLTITSQELHRVVHALGSAIDTETQPGADRTGGAVVESTTRRETER
jgi:adenosylmethionine-8-amino-7-oxononanoate aminotransferase